MIKSMLSKRFLNAQELSYFLTEIMNKIVKINKNWIVSKTDENTQQVLTSLHTSGILTINKEQSRTDDDNFELSG